MPTVSRVTIVAALPSEAEAIAQRFGLSCVCEQPFTVYEGTDTCVIVSGIGAEQSAAAVGFMAGRRTRAERDIWINCGIAGHRSLALGTPVLADKVSAAGVEDTWYPSLLFDAPCRTGEIKTFDRAISAYPQAPCCDMEAAGFMAAATAVAQSECVHVLKIVSDNAQSDLGRITRAFVRELINDNVACLTALVERLRGLAALLPVGPHDGALDAMLVRWHFTYAQTAQLRRLHARYRALADDVNGFGQGIDACTNAAQVLRAIETGVDALPLRVA